MKDKVNAIPSIGEIIKEELNKQGKTTVQYGLLKN